MERTEPAAAAVPSPSVAEVVSSWPRETQAEFLQGLSTAARNRFRLDWRAWGRPAQLPPPGDWRLWLMLAGRGFGKTRAGAEWVNAEANRGGAIRIALIAATSAEARAVMVEGESGILAVAHPGERPRWEPSLGRLTYRSGAVAQIYSAAEPNVLRGPQHHLAWADEIAKWAQATEAWDNLQMGLRLGERPRAVATTTPRPVPLIRRLVAASGTAVTRGRTEDNEANLAPGFVRAMREVYGGTRLGRQELDGEIIEDVEGALWPRLLIERCRVAAAPARRRVVIGVDPPAGIGGDACGIVAVALGEDGHGYVIDDASIAGAGPEGWARAVAATAERHRADRVVAEANNGGAMVESVLRAADAVLPLRLVHASFGKVARAEPVAALYEVGRMHHLGAFPALEDEMAGLILGGGYGGPGRSPDRADALVWAVTELLLGRRAQPGMRLI